MGSIIPLPSIHRWGGGIHLPIPNGVKASLLNVLTLGAYQHPDAAKEYWTSLAQELDPRTPQGLVALGATVFGPRLDEPAITALRSPEGDLVPMPRAGKGAAQRVTSNAARNLQHDFSNNVRARLMRAHEADPVAHHIESVSKRASLTNQPENLHSYVESNDQARGEPHASPQVLHESLRPAQAALLRMLLARERMA